MEWPESDEGDDAVLELDPAGEDDALGDERARRTAWEVFALFYWRNGIGRADRQPRSVVTSS